MNSILCIVLAFVQIMSYNIRVSNAQDGPNDWEIRKPATLLMIQDQKPDVIGVQEALEDQCQYLKENVAGYAVTGDSPNPILYRTDRYEIIDSGSFWLSETPEKPSKGWDGSYVRTANWALFKDKRNGKLFYMVNTHLDDAGAQARIKGLQLIESRFKDINKDNLPMALTGDFNCTVKSPAIDAIRDKMSNSRETARRTDEVKSFNNWGRGGDNIDFVWYSNWKKCTRFRTITKTYGNAPYVSDHYPVIARLVY